MIMPNPDDDAFDVELFNQLLSEVAHRQNHAPDPELGGLSPDQVARLIYGDWLSGDHAVHIATDLPLAEYESSPMFRSMRKVLVVLCDHGEVKATKGGNFTRTFVREMIPFMFDDDLGDMVTQLYKAPNEEQVWRLHVSRIVCTGAGLISKYKGNFRVPKNKRVFLADERAGELCSILFAAYFQQFNLGYSWAVFDMVSTFQAGIAYTLYRLGQVATDWVLVDDAFARQVLLPVVQDECEKVAERFSYWNLEELVHMFLFCSAKSWGLVECKDDMVRGIKVDHYVRTTPLYHRLLRFQI